MDMEQLYMMIISFLKTYGWQMTVCAMSGIVLLGCLKAFKAFDKVVVMDVAEDGTETLNVESTKKRKKKVYIFISAVISIFACVICQKILGTFSWASLGVISGTILGINQGAYAIYENVGIRDLVKWLLAKLKLGALAAVAGIKELIKIAKQTKLDKAAIKQQAVATLQSIGLSQQDVVNIVRGLLQETQKAKDQPTAPANPAPPIPPVSDTIQ